MISALGLFAALASSCASSYEPAAPPPRDVVVSELLPTGAYAVTGGQVDMKYPISIEGFVDFGSLEDGEDCESSYTLRVPVELSGGAEPQVIEGVRTAGEPSWYRDVTDASTPGAWLDNADPSAPASSVFLFIPQIVADDSSHGIREGAGTGVLCSIPVMPRFMTVGEDGTLLFDQPRASATAMAALDRYGVMLVDAVGLTGSRRSEVLRTAADVGPPTFEGLLEGASIKMVETGEGFTLTLYKEDERPGRILVELRFVRTEDRPVERVQGATFFEKLAAEVRENPDAVEKHFPQG